MGVLVFNDFSEVKLYIGANANNDIDTLQPYIADAARDYLKPVLGAEEWDSLITNFPDSLTDEQEAILPYVRNVLANFGYYLFADDGGVNITDSGITRTEDDQSKSAYQWQVRLFKERRWVNGWNALEELAQYLYNNLDQYPTWYDSDERVVWNDMVVWSSLQFKHYYRINGWATLWTLHPHLKEMQETVLRPLITTEVYDAVITEIHTADMGGDIGDLLPYVQRVVVMGTLMEVVKNAGYEFGKNGLQVSTIEATSQNSDKTANVVNYNRDVLYEEFRKKYEKGRNLLINYMDENASATVYASYYTKYINVDAAEVVDNNEGKGLKFFG